MRLTPRLLLEEYVSPRVFEQYGIRASRFICKTLLNATTQLVLDLEEEYGRPISVSINTWLWGGTRVASGLRMPGTPHYSITSAHAWGKGDDKQFKFKDGDKEVLPTKEVYEFIIKNEKKYYELGIRRMEDLRDAPTWIHWDVIWTSLEEGKIQIVRTR
jgi:hypothetical protein